MQNIEKLKELFMQFPGIGPRQAGRFVHFLLMRGDVWRSNFVNLVQELDSSVVRCKVCMRFFESINKHNEVCSICNDKERDSSKLLLVVNDVDIRQVESSAAYKGKYFVLGALLAPGRNKKSYARERELQKLLKGLTDNNELKEIIFAFPATPDGEFTTDELQRKLGNNNIKMTVLGRGLSTGSEIEYADSETIKNALYNRS